MGHVMRYKTPSFQTLYDAMLAAAANPQSELYFQGKPHRGAGHRTAFWDGYAGVVKSANVVPRTPSAVCFAAGKVFARPHPGICVEDAVWTPGVTRQGEKTDVALRTTNALGARVHLAQYRCGAQGKRDGKMGRDWFSSTEHAEVTCLRCTAAIAKYFSKNV